MTYPEACWPKIFLVFFAILFLTGCAAPRLSVTAANKQIEARLPVVDIDRYETVIYPAGPIQ